MSGHPHAYDLLKSIIHLTTSSLPIEAKLDQMLHSISSAFQSDQCLLLRPDRIAENGFLSRVASGKEALWVEETRVSGEENALPGERAFLMPSFACIPLQEEDSFQGLLYLGFLKNRRFSPEDRDLLLSVSQEMGEVIRKASLHPESQETLSELMVLHEMGKAIASSLKLEHRFEKIVETGLKLLKARGGVLRIEDRKTGELKVRYLLGDNPQEMLDEKIAKKVFSTRVPLSVDPSDEEHGSLPILCAPLVSNGNAFGTLAFHGKEDTPSRFDERDFQLLSTLANQTSSALENALIHYETAEVAHDLETRVKQLSTLWELNKALLTTMDFDRIIQMTLTAITMGDGLRFNRAMLFLVNGKDRVLEGIMAVGPDNAEEAGRIWHSLSQRGGSPTEFMTQQPPSPEKNTVLNAIVTGIRVPLEQEQCILSKTVLQAEPFRVQLPNPGAGSPHPQCERGCHLGAEVGCYVGERLSRDPRPYSFATVPLWGKGEVIGVILVDNLYNQNPITEEDIRYLSMFSNQAGLAIENANLYRNLSEVHQELQEAQTFVVHREKMAALGELTNAIAHEIRNPLVSIGGFARRLYRAIPEDTPEKRYTETIMTEVTRLEKILSDFFNYTRDESMVFKELDIRELVEESLSTVSESPDRGGVEVIKDFAEGLPKMVGDYHHLKQAFCNLILNAREAMRGQGTLSIHIHPVSKKGATRIRVEVEDTGNGIDPENLNNVFNPFYTTKNGRLGLGLPIVHKIVTSHRGQIEIDNQLGKGATFIVTLPVKEEKQESARGSLGKGEEGLLRPVPEENR